MSIAGRTCLFDSFRLFFQGALDSVLLSVCLLLAIRVFHASVAAKGLLSSLVWVGGLVAPFLVRRAATTGWRASRLGASLFVIVGIFFACAAFANSLAIYVICISLAGIFYRSEGAILSRIYGDNYDPGQRASRMAPGLVLSALMAIAFGHCCGIALDANLGHSRHILLAAAACALLCSCATAAIPSTPIHSDREEGRHCSYLVYFRRDPLFAKLAIYFTAVGFAYQMLIPMRVEHLANYRYGWNLDNFSIVLLSWIIPSCARVLCTPLIAILFDRLHLIATRILVNGVFFAGILFYFNGHSFTFLAIGGVLLGAAMAGSFVMHNLWLTKIISPEKLPAYTSIYLMMTGIRSIFAPIAAYGLFALGSPTTAAHGAALILIAATFGFWSLRRNPAIR
jgi:MFS family permease